MANIDLEANPSWQVDLGSAATIDSIVVWNCTDCGKERLSDYWFLVSIPGLSSWAGALAVTANPGPSTHYVSGATLYSSPPESR